MLTMQMTITLDFCEKMIEYIHMNNEGLSYLYTHLYFHRYTMDNVIRVNQDSFDVGLDILSLRIIAGLQ